MHLEQQPLELALVVGFVFPLALYLLVCVLNWDRHLQVRGPPGSVALAAPRSTASTGPSGSVALAAPCAQPCSPGATCSFTG